MIRPFELRDLPILHRYRKQGIYMDNLHTLTWGKGVVLGRAIFSPLSGAVGIFTQIYRPGNKRPVVIGQASHTLSATHAQLTFLAPDKAIHPEMVDVLLEHLIQRLGERRAQSLIAEVPEKTNTFETLRRSGFSIYARQHIWRVGNLPRKKTRHHAWREILSQDEFNVRKLYHAVVPALVQQVEPTPWDELRGKVFYHQGELLAYVDVVEGPGGIWMQPFIHPEMEDIGQHLIDLLVSLHPKERRPVFVCLRSYHAGLSMYLEELGAQASTSQAVMVRRLTATVKKPELAPLPAINGSTEVTTPYLNSLPRDNR